MNVDALDLVGRPRRLPDGAYLGAFRCGRRFVRVEIDLIGTPRDTEWPAVTRDVCATVAWHCGALVYAVRGTSVWLSDFNSARIGGWTVPTRAADVFLDALVAAYTGDPAPADEIAQHTWGAWARLAAATTKAGQRRLAPRVVDDLVAAVLAHHPETTKETQ